jgi:hypothetical protein
VLHLHGLQNHKHIAGVHRIAGPDLPANELGLQRCFDGMHVADFATGLVLHAVVPATGDPAPCDKSAG